MAILGVNPIKKYREFKEDKNLSEELPSDLILGPDGNFDEQSLSKLSDGQRKMLTGLNALGLTNSAIV